MAYKLDISSDESLTAADIAADQALIVCDHVNNRIKVIAKDSDGDTLTAYLRKSKRYAANLTQTAGNDPVATVLENDIGAIVWARSGAGVYTATLAGAFTANKTLVTVGTPIPVDTMASIEVALTSTDVITITTKNYKTADDTATVLDALLTNTAIVIEVFP